MPDILIENDCQIEFFRKIANRHVVPTAPLICYVFYVDETDDDLEYRKTLDGGITWSLPTKIRTGVVTRFDVWYEQWTNNDEGTVIHIASQDSLSNETQYMSLNTADDVVTAAVLILNNNTSGGNNRTSAAITITKARGNGFLYVMTWQNGTGGGVTPHAFFQSDDSGATWNEMADGADGDEADEVQLIPGNEADTDDVWMIYWDRDADEISLKVFDFSLDSWSETLISASMADNISNLGMKVTMRHSDNHAILVAWNEFDTATADLMAWDIASTVSITPLTDVLTNSAESYWCCILCNQQDDRLFVGYMRGATLQSSVAVFYKISADGGVTWDAEEAMSDDPDDDHRYIDSGLSIGNAGGKWQPVWFNDDLNDLFTNSDNGITIPVVIPTPDVSAALPEYGQIRTAIGEPSVYGATIFRS